MSDLLGQTWLDLGNVIWIATAAAALGWLGALACRKTRTPVAHGITVAAALGVVLAPVLGWTGGRHVGLFEFAPTSIASTNLALRNEPVQAGQVEAPQEELVQAPSPLEHEQPIGSSWSIPFPWLDVVVFAWAIGMLVTTTRHGLACITAWRLRQNSMAPHADVQEAVHRLASCMGMRPPAIAESRSTAVPVALGPFRPLLLLPLGFAERVSSLELEAALRHELGHLAGNHHWAALLQAVAETLFWWNPLVRLLGRLQDSLQEEIADNFVLAGGLPREAYARFLLALAERQAWPVSRVGIAIFARRSTLSYRVELLLQKERSIMTHLTIRGRASLVLVTLAVVAFLMLASIRMSDAAMKAPLNFQEGAAPSATGQTGGGITVQSFKQGQEIPMGKAEILRPADKPPTIIYPASRASTDTIEIKNGTRVAVAEGLEWQGKIAYLSLTFDLVVVDAKSKKCQWSKSVGAFWDTITFESVAEQGEKARWELALRSSAKPEYQQNYDLETGMKRELKGGPPVPAGKPFTPRKVWSGSAGVREQKLYRLVRTGPEWNKLREGVFGDKPKDIPTAEEIDWNKETLLICYAGKTSNWSGTDVELAVENDERLLLRLRRMTYQSIGNSVEEHPYGLIILPKQEAKPYVLEYNQQSLIAGPPIWREFTRLKLNN